VVDLEAWVELGIQRLIPDCIARIIAMGICVVKEGNCYIEYLCEEYPLKGSMPIDEIIDSRDDERESQRRRKV
jgi:hypothetical protein